MLAERTRIVGLVAAVGLAIGALAMARLERSEPIERLALETTSVVELDRTQSSSIGEPIICSLGRPAPSTDTLFVVLREKPEWTGAEEESDWSKSYRMAWNGPIRTWTTMRNVRVPSLDHRMIESIEPVPAAPDAVFVHVRVVVPGDLDAALDWVRSRPDVDRASIRYEYRTLAMQGLSGTIGDAR